MIEEERRAEVEKEAVDTAEEERKAEVEKTVEWIEELVKKGNITKIQIKKDGNVYINIPLNIGIVGTVIGLATAPWALLTSALITIGTDCQVELYTTDGKVIDISGKSFGKKMADVGSVISGDIREVFPDSDEDETDNH